MVEQLRCPRCRKLLAIRSDDQIEIRHKEACYVVTDAKAIVATCPRGCGAVHLSD